MNGAEIGVLAYNAGIHSQGNLQAAIAIALAESAGNPNAVGDVSLQDATYGPSLGLWQIRSVKAESGKGTSRDGTRLKDPTFNAKAMFEISKGGKDWGPWSTWPLQAAVHMPAAAITANGVLVGRGINIIQQDPSGAISGALGDIGEAVTPDGVQDIAEGVRATTRWIGDRNNWFRVMKVGVGSVLLVGGVILVAKPLITNAAASEVGKVAGKVLKAKG